MNVIKVLATLRPGLNCQPKPGLLTAAHISDVQFDPPLPNGFVPPTQEEVEAEAERLANPVPQIVTSGAFIRAAHELDWLEGIETAVATAGQQNSLLPLLWARSSQFERPHPFVALIGQAMGKTSAEIDDLFRRAGGYDQ